MFKTLRFALAIITIRFFRWFKPVLFFLLFAWCVIAFGVGEKFDSICVEGRLSAEQAEALNVEPWGHCPSYRREECKAEENDRVFVGQCSEFFKFMWRPDKWGKALRGEKLPWKY